MAVFAYSQDRVLAILGTHALDLVGDHVACLVPADAHELGLAAVLRVNLVWIATGLPVDALKRVLDTIVRVDALLVSERLVRRRRFHGALQRFAARRERPQVAFELLLCVLVGIADRPNANNLAVLGIDSRQFATGAATCHTAVNRGFWLLPRAVGHLLICHEPLPSLSSSVSNRNFRSYCIALGD